MARFEAQCWRVVEYQGQELVSCWSDHDETEAQAAAGRYVEALANEGYELTPEELADGTRQVRAVKGNETRVVQVETREH